MTEAREVRKRRRHRRAKDEILEAAISVIERRGSADFTIAAIAEEAGVSKPSVYYYFSNRDEVLWELAHSWSTRCAQRSIERIADLRGAEAAEALVREWVEMHRDRLPLFRAVNLWPQLGKEPPGSVTEAINREMNRMFATIERCLDGSLPPGIHARRTGVAIWTSAYGLLHMLSLLDATGHGSVHALDDLLDSHVAMARRACGEAV